MTFMMLYPYVIRPTEMVALSTASCHTGTAVFFSEALPYIQVW